MKSACVGAHIPIDNSLKYLALGARALDVGCFQFFVGSSTRFTLPKWHASDIEKFRVSVFGLKTYIHMPYTLNWCAPSSGKVGRFQSVILRKFGELGSMLRVDGLVLHVGFKKEMSDDEATSNVLGYLNGVREWVDNVPVLLEIDSGSKNGSKAGSPEFIEGILQSLDGNFGMVVDTEHCWARGLNLWDNEVLDQFYNRYKAWIKLVHFNVPDEGVALGSFVDRHNRLISSFELSSDYLLRKLGSIPLLVERSNFLTAVDDVSYLLKFFAKV